MDASAIIPTLHRKHKIPKTHTYPLGAKMVSEVLAGVPQFEQLSIGFWYLRPMARFHKPSTQYQVLQVSYSGPTRLFTGSQEVPKWEVRVDAVPRSLRHVIQDKLVATALPAIRQWLIANPHSNEREGFHALTFTYDELEDELRSDDRSTTEWQTSRA